MISRLFIMSSVSLLPWVNLIRWQNCILSWPGPVGSRDRLGDCFALRCEMSFSCGLRGCDLSCLCGGGGCGAHVVVSLVAPANIKN